MKTAIEKKTAEILHDLIQINNDRVKGYEKASKELKDKDNDLQDIFDDMADQSRDYSAALNDYLQGDEEEGTTTSGKIYRVWMDVKATFTGADRKAVLSACEYGEDAAQKAYKEALGEASNLTGEVRDTVAQQQMHLKESHDHIKSLRDKQIKP